MQPTELSTILFPGKITWYRGNIMETSWNFVVCFEWEPCRDEKVYLTIYKVAVLTYRFSYHLLIYSLVLERLNPFIARTVFIRQNLTRRQILTYKDAPRSESIKYFQWP